MAANSIRDMDTVSRVRRSEIMSSVRHRGNRSTEWRLRAILVRSGISGWTLHPKHLPGTPDFAFPRFRLAIFVNGCFWHGCPKCGRLPKSNREFWRAKILTNIMRDRRCRSRLKRLGWRVIDLWEHEFQIPGWFKKLRILLRPEITPRLTRIRRPV